jgi:hypothetical protein
VEFLNQLGGLPFIISTSLAVVSFVAYTIREINIKKWEKTQEEKHLLLSQNFTRNENILSQTITSMMNITHGTNEMRLSGYQKIWIMMLKIKNNFPPFLSTTYSILTRDEFKNIFRTDNLNLRRDKHRDKPLMEAFLISLETISKEAEESRFMVNANAWNIYCAYQFFFGRLATLYSIGIEEEAPLRFLDDDPANNVLEKIIGSKALSKLKIPEVFAFQNIFSFLEIKFIEQFSDALSGFLLTKETIDNALEINRIVRSIPNSSGQKGE